MCRKCHGPQVCKIFNSAFARIYKWLDNCYAQHNFHKREIDLWNCGLQRNVFAFVDGKAALLRPDLPRFLQNLAVTVKKLKIVLDEMDSHH
jgi:hypothetical protein